MSDSNLHDALLKRKLETDLGIESLESLTKENLV